MGPEMGIDDMAQAWRDRGVRFWAHRGGNISVMFALLCVPMIGATGLAVDYGRALTVKHRLAAAVDSAAVGSIAEKSPGAQAATGMTTDGRIPLGETDARQLLDANLIKLIDADDVAFTVAVEKHGNLLKSRIDYTANVPTTLAKVFGKTAFTVSGTATAEHQVAVYQDYYILIDNTPSMGIAATSADIKTMENNTADQQQGRCAFACHETQGTQKKDNYAVARKLGVNLRIDVVRQATQALTDQAKISRGIADQFRMGVYTFGAAAEAAGLTTVADQTTNLSTVKTKAQNVDLMTIPQQGYNNDQQTSFDSVFGGIKSKIGVAGDGSTADRRQKILFLVSDGVGDSYKPLGCTRKLTGSTRCQEPIDTRICQPLKDQGVKIAVLYTTYLPLPSNDWYNTWIKPFQSQIATRMEACASPGFYYEVGLNQGIQEAMLALFAKTIRVVRLSS